MDSIRNPTGGDPTKRYFLGELNMSASYRHVEGVAIEVPQKHCLHKNINWVVRCSDITDSTFFA